MSQVKISGDASGTGIFTISAPNSNTNRALVLPNSAGTMATAESTLAQFNVTGSAPVFACRAFVNFNGTGTVAIRGSGNVSSITDNGVGLYTVNFTTAMPDANYTAVSGVGIFNLTTEFQSQCNVNGPYSTSSLSIATGFIASTSEALQDKSLIQVAIFR